MAILGQPINPYQKWDFVVEIENVPVGGFHEATGLEIDQKIAITREGGNPGISSIAYTTHDIKPVTLSRGASLNTSLFDWWKNIANGAQDLRAICIVQQRGGIAIKRTNYALCALTNYKDDGNDRGKEEENVIESVTFQPTKVERI